jgi:hypothetical protein
MTVSIKLTEDEAILTTITHKGTYLEYYQNFSGVTTVKFTDSHTGYRAINRGCKAHELQDLIFLFQEGVNIAKLSTLCRA